MEQISVRDFRFRSGAEQVVDTLRPDARPGFLVNLIGSARRVGLRLHCDVTAAGALRMCSESAWIRIRGRRVPLPAPLGVRAHVISGFDDARGTHTIRTTVLNPALGAVLEYRGEFRSWVEDA